MTAQLVLGFLARSKGKKDRAPKVDTATLRSAVEEASMPSISFTPRTPPRRPTRARGETSPAWRRPRGTLSVTKETLTGQNAPLAPMRAAHVGVGQCPGVPHSNVLA